MRLAVDNDLVLANCSGGPTCTDFFVFVATNTFFELGVIFECVATRTKRRAGFLFFIMTSIALPFFRGILIADHRWSM